MFWGSAESGASRPPTAASDRLACRNKACASGANCVSIRLTRLDAARNAPLSSVPIASNGTRSSLVRMLLSCCCN
ncbi:hypothetical protein D3C71_1836300 [compost metagenome]